MPIKLGTANTPSRRNMPIEQIDRVKAQHGWTVPFYSSLGTSFSDDSVVGGGFLLNALLRDGDEVYRTYTTGSRGVDRLMFVNNIQDLSVYGRQEDWEDSPEGGHSSDPQLTMSARPFTWLSEAGDPAPRTQLASDASPGDGAGNARTPRQSRHR